MSDYLSKVLLTVVSLMVGALTFAQQGQAINANSNNEVGGSSMASAVVWIIGLAFFVILLISMLRPGKKT